MTTDPQTVWRYARLDELRRTQGGEVENLSDAERAELAHWRHPERRDEWIRARGLARGLVAEHLPRQTAGSPHLEILSRGALGRSVRPTVSIAGKPVPLSLSISHTRSAALAAVCTARGVTIGVDLVHKAPLTRGFLESWFDGDERLEADAEGSFAACRLWAVKEAVYKAAHRDDPFAPRQISLRRGKEGEYRCSYRGVDLSGRCVISTWECDDHVAALAVVQEGPAEDYLPAGLAVAAIGGHPAGLELLTSQRI